MGYRFRGVTQGGRSPTGVTPRKRWRKSCCRDLRQIAEVGVIGRSGVKARMRSLTVVEVEIAADRRTCLADAVIGLEIDFFIFDRAPQSLDEDVVAPGPFAIHADGDCGVLQQVGEVQA